MKITDNMMQNLSAIGRIFYGTAIAETGLETIYFGDFPYWMLPPKHAGMPGFAVIAMVGGAALLFAGIGLVMNKQTRLISLLLGYLFLMIFCFYYVPYVLLENVSDIRKLVWHNAEKELAMCSGAFVIAHGLIAGEESSRIRLIKRIAPYGVIVFSLTMISFGIAHFRLAAAVATLVPAWIPGPMFWTYAAGVALLGSGLAIILRIKSESMAFLLGCIIFIWVIILHIPRIAASPAPYLASEIASTFIALAYSGTAFAIAGWIKKNAG